MLRKLGSLLLFLLASSLLMTATVHAREIPGAIMLECSGTVHQDGDADQSPGDADKAMPHHHGSCHGSSLNIPTIDMLSPTALAGGLRPCAAADSATASHIVDPALRPPAA